MLLFYVAVVVAVVIAVVVVVVAVVAVVAVLVTAAALTAAMVVHCSGGVGCYVNGFIAVSAHLAHNCYDMLRSAMGKSCKHHRCTFGRSSSQKQHHLLLLVRCYWWC